MSFVSRSLHAPLKEIWWYFFHLYRSWFTSTPTSIRLANATSQRSNQRSNRQNWFWTKIASHAKACWNLEVEDRRSTEKRPRTSPIPSISWNVTHEVVKELSKPFRPLRRNDELRPARDISPSMLLYGTLYLSPFPRVVTPSLASSIGNRIRDSAWDCSRW